MPCMRKALCARSRQQQTRKDEDHMKKFLSLLLALTLVLSLVVVPARAAGELIAPATATVDKDHTASVTAAAPAAATLPELSGKGEYTAGTPTWSWTTSSSKFTITSGSDTAAVTIKGTEKTTSAESLSCHYSVTYTKAAGNETPEAPDTISVTRDATVNVTVTDTQGDADKAALANAVKGSGAIVYNGRPCTAVVDGKVTGYTYAADNNTRAWTANVAQVTGYTNVSISFSASSAISGTATVTGTIGDPAKTITTTVDYQATAVSAPITSSLTGTTATNNEQVLKGGSLTLSVPSTIAGVTTPTYEWFVGDGVTPVSTSRSFTTFDTSTATSAKNVVCKVYNGSGVDRKLAATSSCAVAVVDETYTLKVTASATTLTALNQTSTVTANLYQGTDTSTTPIASANLKNWNMSVTGNTSAFTTNYTSGNNSLTLTAKSSGTVTISATVTYKGKTFTTTVVNCATVKSSILSYTLPAIQSGTYADYSNSTLLNYANQIVNRPVGGFKSITAATQSDANGLGTLTASYVGTASEQYRFSNVSAARKIGLAQFSATAYTGLNKSGTAYTVYFNVPVEPTGTTYEDQYPEPVASGNTYRYYVQVPSGYYSYYIVGTPNQAARPTDWSRGSSSVYYATTSTSSLYSLTDTNFVGGKCTLWIVTADSSGRLSCGQLTVYQKNYNINYNGVAGETVQFAQSDFNDFMNKVAEARGDAGKAKSYPYVTFDYVTFSLPTTAQGTLYYGGTAMSTSNSSGAFNTRTKVTNLDSVTFVPNAKSTAKTITLNFTLYATRYSSSSTSRGTTVSYSGSVVVNLVREDIKYTVSQGDSVRFDESDFLSYLCSTKGYSNNYTIDYVTFDQSAVSAVNGGSLYTYYNGYNYGGSVKTTDKFYYSATASQNALSDVAFLASRYAKTGETVYIPFTIYARYGTTGTGTRQLTGTVAIKIGQTMNFIDVKTTDYFYNSVKWAVGKNITNGTSSTTFSPYKSCTRAEIVTFLWRAAGSPEPTTTRNPFRDVNAVTHSSYYKAILWASQKGITSGTSTTAFSPDQVCTRAQIVTFLYRYAGQPSGYYSNPFKDVGATSEASYYNAIRWAVGKGITSGTSATTFSPYASCNRAEAVTFLYRYTNGL